MTCWHCFSCPRTLVVNKLEHSGLGIYVPTTFTRECSYRFLNRQIERIKLEMRQCSMLAIANLVSCFGIHDNFVLQNAIPMLVSFLNSADAEMRNFAAFVTHQWGWSGGRALSCVKQWKCVQQQLLPGLATLSYPDSNKMAICLNEALPPINDFLQSEGRSSVCVCVCVLVLQ